MPFPREVYTFTHTLFMTGAIGVAATVGTSLLGLSLIGKPIYDDETHRQREAEHNRAVFEWNSKSPEERAIITAARRIELLQMTQILQNNRIIQNQEQAKTKRRY